MQTEQTVAQAAEAKYRRQLRATKRALRAKRECAADNCHVWFKPTRKSHIFHCDACRQHAHRYGQARVTADTLT